MRKLSLTLALMLTAGIAEAGRDRLSVCSFPGAHFGNASAAGKGAIAGVDAAPLHGQAACFPSEEELERVLSQAIPLALSMERDDFLRLASDSPVAAALIAMMLWRGDGASMTDAIHFSAQFRGMPSYADAVALFDDYDARIAGAWSVALPRDAFLHGEVSGTREGADRVELTIQAAEVTTQARTPLGSPVTVRVGVGKQQIASSFAGKRVIAREAVTTYP